MSEKYNIYLVPQLNDRKKISLLRKEICKRCFTTQALQYPVHLSLTSGTNIPNYEEFEEELQQLCKELRPITLISQKMTTIATEVYWTGISFTKTKELVNLQISLENLKNKHSTKGRELNFIPHITLAFPAKVDELKPSLNPVQELFIDRVTIAKRESKNAKYRIYKHYKLG